MPRKPRKEKKTIQVVIDSKPYAVVLHPPVGTHSTWYCYWAGSVYKRSTGQSDEVAAVVAAEEMLRRWLKGDSGHRAAPADARLSDDELIAIQKAHFGRKTDSAARVRAAKSLEECLDAITAFQAISGLSPVSLATADDCASFQRKALERPKNWRKQHPRSKQTDETISPNTVLKWSRCLQSSFERANRSAGKKCVRGVVDDGKLLTSNPWTQFTWIEGTKAAIRQFDSDELLALVDHLDADWGGVPVASAAIKVFLWSGCRKLEVAGLTWDMVRSAGDEVHFEIVGKWGVERWFRVPCQLYGELLALRTGSPFVFAAYTEQISRVHADNLGCLRKIRDEFTARNFGGWLYNRVKEWSSEHPKGRAFLHVFRKTALQHARRGEDINRLVAADARVGESVMMTNYVKETDDELRARSNRTYRRILASLSPEVARRYGHEEAAPTLERQIEIATAAKDWGQVAVLSARLVSERRSAAG